MKHVPGETDNTLRSNKFSSFSWSTGLILLGEIKTSLYIFNVSFTS